MNFQATLYPLVFLGAFATAFLTLPLWHKWCSRTGLVDDPGHRKIHDSPIPLAGGLAVMSGLTFPALLGLIALCLQPGEAQVESGVTHESFSIALLHPDSARELIESVRNKGLEFATLLAGALGMLLVGLFDDKYELQPAIKLAGQVLVAFLVAASGARITLFVPNVLFSYAITILWIVTVINALNFMDNMNGLCGGLGAIGACFFAVIAARAGQHATALIALLTCGALMGFLPHNFPRARAFLGDSGSHLVGYVLAVLAILPDFYTRTHPRRLAVLSPLLILAVPLGDLLRVVLVRLRNGKAIYTGDNNHLSHWLVQRGFTRTRAVCLIWLAALLAGAAALWLES